MSSASPAEISKSSDENLSASLSRENSLQSLKKGPDSNIKTTSGTGRNLYIIHSTENSKIQEVEVLQEAANFPQRRSENVSDETPDNSEHSDESAKSKKRRHDKKREKLMAMFKQNKGIQLRPGEVEYATGACVPFPVACLLALQVSLER